MYNWLKNIINSQRSLKSKKSNHDVVKLMLWAYIFRNPTLCTLIHKRPNFRKDTPKGVLGRVNNNDILHKEAHYEPLHGVPINKPQEIALKATKRQKAKAVKEESSSEREDEDEEESSLDEKEMSLFIQSFKKLMNGRKDKG